jgi:hypothetical protein
VSPHTRATGGTSLSASGLLFSVDMVGPIATTVVDASMFDARRHAALLCAIKVLH